MKKVILGLALVLAVGLSASVSAKDNNAKKGKAKTETCCKKDKDTKECSKKDAKACDKKKSKKDAKACDKKETKSCCSSKGATEKK